MYNPNIIINKRQSVFKEQLININYSIIVLRVFVQYKLKFFWFDQVFLLLIHLLFIILHNWVSVLILMEPATYIRSKLLNY